MRFKMSIQPLADDVRLEISRGEMSGSAAFMKGKYKVSGNLDLLMRMAKLFPASHKG